MSACEDVEDRVLVLIQLKGGNDGLNAVIPINQYDLYANLRPSIKIPDTGNEKFINLDTTLSVAKQVGIHPKMLSFKQLYDQGWASVIQAAGYEDMNQSHFTGSDLWLSGGDSTLEGSAIGSGWMGRSLQAMYPDVLGGPTTNNPDPLGIQLGDSSPSLGFHTETEHQNVINLSGQDAAGFYSLIQTIGGAPLMNVPESEYGDEIEYIQGVEQSVNDYAQRISEVFNAGTNALTTYPDTSLADQLKTVARLDQGRLQNQNVPVPDGRFRHPRLPDRGKQSFLGRSCRSASRPDGFGESIFRRPRPDGSGRPGRGLHVLGVWPLCP